ncbi:uncharacterized protein LOC105421748 [Amborella trichopoda]|uniref:uncharacterized protein LOC105421748 n=1 Tax=Amborella trichopoda TaxID=13333 RepID=UPI0005D3AC9A|nr:uncharacterized protein LOC105421748 [Amborella trichopoda]|eukprot:XP_011628656.1 uncharacterized protein LOC105421748 [Amborella trichopoda]
MVCFLLTFAQGTPIGDGDPSSLEVIEDLLRKGEPVEGSAGRSGVIRNSVGAFIEAFAKHFGFASNNHVKFLAFEEGVQLVIQNNCSPIQIESDSTLLVNVIQNRCNAPWRLKTIVDNCCTRLSSHRWSITHVFREANMVANALAKRAAAGPGAVV